MDELIIRTKTNTTEITLPISFQESIDIGINPGIIDITVGVHMPKIKIINQELMPSPIEIYLDCSIKTNYLSVRLVKNMTDAIAAYDNFTLSELHFNEIKEV